MRGDFRVRDRIHCLAGARRGLVGFDRGQGRGVMVSGDRRRCSAGQPKGASQKVAAVEGITDSARRAASWGLPAFGFSPGEISVGMCRCLDFYLGMVGICHDFHVRVMMV